MSRVAVTALQTLAFGPFGQLNTRRVGAGQVTSGPSDVIKGRRVIIKKTVALVIWHGYVAQVGV